MFSLIGTDLFTGVTGYVFQEVSPVLSVRKILLETKRTVLIFYFFSHLQGVLTQHTRCLVSDARNFKVGVNSQSCEIVEKFTETPQS